MIQPAGKPRNPSFNIFGDVSSFNDQSGEMKKAQGLTFQEKRSLTLREKEDITLRVKQDKKDNPQAYRNWQEQPAMKTNRQNKDNMFRTAKSIISAQDGVITEQDSPIRPIGRTNTNTIWDSERIAAIKDSKEMDNGEKIKSQLEKHRAERQALRKDCRNLSINTNDLRDILKNGDQPKGNSVHRTSDETPTYGQRVATHNFSIHDDGKTLEDKMPELTVGEKIAAHARARKSRDNSYAARQQRAESFEKMAPHRSTRNVSDEFYNNFKAALDNLSGEGK